MKPSLLVVLAVALCAERAFSLSCFTCKDASSNIQCMNIATCSDHEKYCLTTYSTTGLGKCAACPRGLMTNGDRIRLTAGCPPTRRCDRKIRHHGTQRKSCGKWEFNCSTSLSQYIATIPRVLLSTPRKQWKRKDFSAQTPCLICRLTCIFKRWWNWKGLGASGRSKAKAW
uniref:Lymphocyte antigen 6 family member D n=1 Tax=Anas platyrhynchos TaxID=8839 RepID=A0A8B9R4A5_ANAPL